MAGFLILLGRKTKVNRRIAMVASARRLYKTLISVHTWRCCTRCAHERASEGPLLPWEKEGQEWSIGRSAEATQCEP